MHDFDRLTNLVTQALELYTEPAAIAGFLASHGVAVVTPTTDRVNINTATLADLRALPGLGNTLATRAYDWRRHRGYYSDIKELLEVPGFGPAVFERIKDKICI